MPPIDEYTLNFFGCLTAHQLRHLVGKMRGKLRKTIRRLPLDRVQLLQMVTDAGLVIHWDALINDTVNVADKPTAAVARFLEDHPDLHPFKPLTPLSLLTPEPISTPMQPPPNVPSHSVSLNPGGAESNSMAVQPPEKSASPAAAEGPPSPTIPSCSASIQPGAAESHSTAVHLLEKSSSPAPPEAPKSPTLPSCSASLDPGGPESNSTAVQPPQKSPSPAPAEGPPAPTISSCSASVQPTGADGHSTAVQPLEKSASPAPAEAPKSLDNDGGLKCLVSYSSSSASEQETAPPSPQPLPRFCYLPYTQPDPQLPFLHGQVLSPDYENPDAPMELDWQPDLIPFNLDEQRFFSDDEVYPPVDDQPCILVEDSDDGYGCESNAVASGPPDVAMGRSSEENGGHDWINQAQMDSPVEEDDVSENEGHPNKPFQDSQQPSEEESDKAREGDDYSGEGGMTNRPCLSNEPGNEEEDNEEEGDQEDDTSSRDANSSDDRQTDAADRNTEGDQLIQTNGSDSHDSSTSEESSANTASQAGVAQSDDKEQTFMPLSCIHAFLPGTPIEAAVVPVDLARLRYVQPVIPTPWRPMHDCIYMDLSDLLQQIPPLWACPVPSDRIGAVWVPLREAAPLEYYVYVCFEERADSWFSRQRVMNHFYTAITDGMEGCFMLEGVYVRCDYRDFDYPLSTNLWRKTVLIQEVFKGASSGKTPTSTSSRWIGSAAPCRNCHWPSHEAVCGVTGNGDSGEWRGKESARTCTPESGRESFDSADNTLPAWALQLAVGRLEVAESSPKRTKANTQVRIWIEREWPRRWMDDRPLANIGDSNRMVPTPLLNEASNVGRVVEWDMEGDGGSQDDESSSKPTRIEGTVIPTIMK
ncbi:hypothetical protein ARMSODRAFT_974109 [Armillaria solidipes]|uniref:Uncharacterized protein n=1 Tax=Armillaria solidipes TaxID=1076256 RepID=A0A2H3BJ21_9AGAR|nr:hypothetical protein ARMSODRAFT_974109 [Armillaria solidipes]